MSGDLALVIDDSQTALSIARRNLEALGYEVETLDAPLMLMDTVRRRRPRLILLDVEMPALSGARLLGIARAHNILTGIQVVFHSSKDPEELQRLAVRFGAAGYLQKTSNKDRFARELEAVLRAAPDDDAAARLGGEATGLGWMDRDHAALMDSVRETADQVRAGRGLEEVAMYLSFLGDFLDYHFAAEETWMDASDYPGTPLHRAEHKDFLAAVSALAARLDRDGPSKPIEQAVLGLQPQIESHIRTQDAELARFLIAHPPVLSPPPEP